MLRPSYSDLMEVIDQQDHIDQKVTSRYTIVIAAAKRARMLIDGQKPLVKGNPDKAVTLAVNEIFEGKVELIPLSYKEMTEIEMNYKAAISDSEHYLEEY